MDAETAAQFSVEPIIEYQWHYVIFHWAEVFYMKMNTVFLFLLTQKGFYMANCLFLLLPFIVFIWAGKLTTCNVCFLLFCLFNAYGINKKGVFRLRLLYEHVLFCFMDFLIK